VNGIGATPKQNETMVNAPAMELMAALRFVDADCPISSIKMFGRKIVLA
jgi:hypothetical protein